MTLVLRSRPRVLVLAVVVVLIAAAFAALASPAQAQEPTGASASKDCPNAVPPNFYTIGDTVTCDFTVENLGSFPGEVTAFQEVSPFDFGAPPPGGTPVDVECTLEGTTTVIGVGDDLPPDVPCAGTFAIEIPDDPALCNSLFFDRVSIDLLYDQFDEPLTAGAFATHVLAVVCRPDITIEKIASPVSKVGDPVNYTITVCNVGDIPVVRDSVDDSLLGDISEDFQSALAPDVCDEVPQMYTVQQGDPDPLVNTVTATYTGGEGIFMSTVTATDDASTDLFAPDVDVTKTCSPALVEVGDVFNCTIVIANTSSDDSPDLVNGKINDSMSGNLLEEGNPAVAESDCTTVLPTGTSCTIVTTHTVAENDPHVIENWVVARYNPDGFPNLVSDGARFRVTVQRNPEIFVTKDAPESASVGDEITYAIRICNVGPITVNQDFVDDSLLGDIAAEFPETLVPDQCATAEFPWVVEAEPDPLVNTVTARYSVPGVGDPTENGATATTDVIPAG
jgi:hypothetical protein